MKIITRYFGDVEFSENDVINFPNGIVGFEQFSKYVLIGFDDEDHAMFCLQGIDEEAPVFIVFNPFKIMDGYDPELSDADMLELKCQNQDDVEYYAIANVSQPMEDTVVNLKSPIAINTINKYAKQVILDKYEIRHHMFKKTEE